ncbi:MAG: endonuclease/exonuclease/phosphatase family protein [Bradymonadia bacterium]
MGRFTVGSFNLRNLVRPGVPYYGREGDSPREVQRKQVWIGRQLDNMRAEIVGVQEVFHADALAGAVERSRMGRHNATVHVSEREGDDGPLPSVGLVTTLPVKRCEFIESFPSAGCLQLSEGANPVDRFSRPVLRAEIELPTGPTVVVFVVHLKSKRPEMLDGEDEHDPMHRATGKARSLIRRASEAIALRHLLVEALHDTDTPVMVMGDLNDAGGAVTSDIITGSPPWGRLPERQKQALWDVLLYNVKDIQARQSHKDVYYTHLHNGHYDALDHILVSQEFSRGNRRGIGHVEYVQVLNDHLVDRTLARRKTPRWHSDHGLVVATFKLYEPSKTR